MRMDAIIFINLAFGFYTVAVWSTRAQKGMRLWHLLLFWIGLVFDTLGTISMSMIAGNGLHLTFHALTGLLAILLMLFHTLWATRVLVKNDRELKLKFYKFSRTVWLIWLVPFVSGAILGMAG